MGRAGGMDNKAARIPDIGEMREEAYIVDDRFASFVAAFDTEGEDGARRAQSIGAQRKILRWRAGEYA